MFNRDYMDYHADRFQDHSLLFYNGESELCAVLPANEKEGVFHSHQGLTFGGFLTAKTMRAEIMLEAFRVLVKYLREQNFIKIEYKAIPYIYHTYPAQEDLYALFRNNARISRVDASTTIPLEHGYAMNKGKKASLSKARRSGLSIRDDCSLEDYFDILSARLETRYRIAPTHNAAEMVRLRQAFPECIRLYTAHQEDAILGGVLLYLSPQVVHTQYIAATEKGLELGANELVLQHIMDIFRGSKPYLDFGISNENRGTYLNAGLVAQKEHYGGRTVVHQFYEMNL